MKSIRNESRVYEVISLTKDLYFPKAWGWSPNSNYFLLGGLRAVAQTIYYDVNLTLTLLYFIYLFSLVPRIMTEERYRMVLQKYYFNSTVVRKLKASAPSMRKFLYPIHEHWHKWRASAYIIVLLSECRGLLRTEHRIKHENMIDQDGSVPTQYRKEFEATEFYG